MQEQCVDRLWLKGAIAMAAVQSRIVAGASHEECTWVVTVYLAEDLKALLETWTFCRQDGQRAAVMQNSFCETAARQIHWDYNREEFGDRSLTALFVVRAYSQLTNTEMFALDCLFGGMPTELGQG